MDEVGGVLGFAEGERSLDGLAKDDWPGGADGGVVPLNDFDPDEADEGKGPLEDGDVKVVELPPR